MQWMKHNPYSPISQSAKMVKDDFLKHLDNMYECLMSKDGNMKCYEHAFVVHKYLLEKPNILPSRFIFFNTNYHQNHWVVSCLCNPWIYLEKAMKKANKDSIGENINTWIIILFMSG